MLLCTLKQYFVRKFAFIVYEKGYDYKPAKCRKFDIGEQCTQERQNRNWRSKLITNVFFLML